MQNLSFLISKNILFGFLAGLVVTSFFAFKIWDKETGCAIALHKNNVFYIGLDNPISIIVRGVRADQVKIEAQGITLIKGADDAYTVRAFVPGEASITVSGGNMEPMRFRYRVKRIPDPMARLGAKHLSRSIGNGEFRAQTGIAAVLENFDFDARCDVVGYEATYMAKRQEPISVMNTGGRFNDNTRDLINQAKPGDVYFFNEIKCKCPGDDTSRNLGALVFRIK